MSFTRKQLEDLGYVERNGEWIKRTDTRRVGAVVSGVGEQPPRPLERTASAKQGGEGSVVDGVKGSVRKPLVRVRSYADSRAFNSIVTVTLVCIRPKFIDPDNLGNGFKALQDAVADWLGVDDGDPRIEWIYRQQVGPKPHGTIVMITTNKGRTWEQY